MEHLREYWLVLIDDTPDESGTSNRRFKVEFAPWWPEHYGKGCLEIIHVREINGSPDNWLAPHLRSDQESGED